VPLSSFLHQPAGKSRAPGAPVQVKVSAFLSAWRHHAMWEILRAIRWLMTLISRLPHIDCVSAVLDRAPSVNALLDYFIVVFQIHPPSLARVRMCACYAVSSTSGSGELLKLRLGLLGNVILEGQSWANPVSSRCEMQYWNACRGCPRA
jgi:hypothetical protein